jgi:superfamily II DNA or RNA helicase
VPIVLRDYQHKAIEDVRAAFRCKLRSVLLVAPTGSGKTVMFSYITHGAMMRGNRVAILAHRIELVDQIAAALAAMNVPHSYVAAGYPYDRRAPVQVCSTQTLARRIDKMPAPELVVIDEAHHATASNTIGQILRKWHTARVLGVTATPIRLSGEGLNEVFEGMVQGPTVADLIEMGALSPVTVYAPPTVDTSGLHLRAGEFRRDEVSATMDKPSITGDAVDHYKRLTPGRPAVVFCASVEHARHVARDFVAAGYSAAHIDGGMDSSFRRSIIHDFRQRKLTVLTSCDLISEGFDVPGIHVGISLRPTASIGLWLQQCGRCLRPADGKDRAVILDHAGNTLRHGLPTEDRQWSLEGRERSTRRTADHQSVFVRVCPQCFGAEPSGRPKCSQCGFVYPVQSRQIAKVDGELQEVKPTDPAVRARKGEQAKASDLEALTELGKMRGYKNPRGWAMHVIAARAAKRKGRGVSL